MKAVSSMWFTWLAAAPSMLSDVKKYKGMCEVQVKLISYAKANVNLCLVDPGPRTFLGNTRSDATVNGDCTRFS